MIRPTRILLYGFGPYRQFKENITAEVIKALAPASGLNRVVFPVRFHRGQFVQALERYQPDVILGLGQSSRRRIEFENRAANRRRARKKSPARTIRSRGPRWLPTTLDIKLSRRVRRSKDAGEYVCNFSMYVMLDQIQRARIKTKFGFMHIPHDVALDEATRTVVGALSRLGRRRFTLKPSKRNTKAAAPSLS